MKCPRCDHAVSKDDRFCGRCGLGLPTDGGRPVDPLIGLVVDNRYRIEHRVGVGGMGTVYLGQHVNLGQKVAIKVLHERHVSKPDLVERFHIEARTYAKVDHPNVVKLMHFDRMADGTTYMVMEYCPGTSMASMLHTETRLDPALAAELAMQIAQGLAATHAAGIVHRDLKPDNIVLTETRPGRYHVKLLDFGIAKDLDDDGPRLTQAGMVFGTPEYMAPEQARGQIVDERSDLYALGCVLYEMLTGDPPFTGKDKMRVMHQQATEAPIPPSERLGGPSALPGPLEDICLQCLAKRPDDRFPNAEALIDAFDELSLLGDLSLVPGIAASGELPRVRTPKPSTPPADTRAERAASAPGDATRPNNALARRLSPPAGQRGMRRPTPSGERPALDGPLFMDPGLPPGLAGDDGLSSTVIVAAGLFIGAIAVAAWFFSAPATHGGAPPVTEGSAIASPASQVDAAVDGGASPVRPAGPVTQAPATRAPKAPATRAPATQAPASKAPATQAPKAPATTAPKAPATKPPKAPATKPPKAPATKAPAPKPPAGPTADARVRDAREALKDGRFGEAELGAKAALAQAPGHPEASALIDEVQALRASYKAGQAANAAGDCVKVIAALAPVVQAAPGLSKAQALVRQCELALPPKGM